MTKPRYQAIQAKDIAQVPLPGDAGFVRVIAVGFIISSVSSRTYSLRLSFVQGEFDDVKGAAETEFDEKKERGHIEMWDVMLKGPFHFVSPCLPCGATVRLHVQEA